MWQRPTFCILHDTEASWVEGLTSVIVNSLNIILASLCFDTSSILFWSLVFFVTTVDVLSCGVKGCVGWRLSLLKCRGSSGSLRLSHWRRISWTCKTKRRDRLRSLTVAATCVCLLSRKRCWVSKSSWSSRYRIRSKTRGGRWEVAVTWSSSNSTWVRPSSPTRRMAGKFERHNDQGQLYIWVNSKADVQIHLGETYRNTFRTKICLHQKWTIVIVLKMNIITDNKCRQKKSGGNEPISWHIILTYLNIIFNWNDFTVMDSGLGIFGNLYLAGHCFLWVLLHSVPGHFAQALVADVGGAMGAVHYSLLQAELDFGFLWGRVAGSANNRYNLTCQKQINTSLHTFFSEEMHTQVDKNQSYSRRLQHLDVLL